MEPFRTRPGTLVPFKPLQYNVELLAYIFTTARQATTDAQRGKFLDWALIVIQEVKRHPKLKDCG